MPRLVLAAWLPAWGAWAGTEESAGAATAALLLARSQGRIPQPRRAAGTGEQTEHIAIIPVCSVDLHNGRLWPTNVKTLLLNYKCLSQA